MVATLAKQFQMKAASGKAAARHSQTEKVIDRLTFGQAVELLRALSTPGLARSD